MAGAETTVERLRKFLRELSPGARSLLVGELERQVDAAVRFCAKVFGREYAALLGKAAEVAAATNPEAARA
jgi:hypothetical protein